jgi:signal peptidase I
VVVFKYPEEPMGKDFTPTNYIKRLIGLPEETIAIFYGKIYILHPDKGLRFNDGPPDDKNLWRYEHMHVDAEAAHERWKKGEFEILRKPPEVVMAMRRIVYDNDHPAKDLKEYPRWINGNSKSWTVDDAAHTFRHESASDPGLVWLRYQHLIHRQGRDKPELITDFMGYNSNEPPPGPPPPPHWVGDLMVECDVTIDKAEGQLALELSRGISRYRAIFDLATGECTLKQIKEHVTKEEKNGLKGGNEFPADDAGEVLAKQPTDLKKPGTYHVRFANVDDRLLMWVDRSLPFGSDGVPYTPSEKKGPYLNDLQPASIGVQGGGVTIGKLQLWRDTYYTKMKREGVSSSDIYPPGINFADPGTWDELRRPTSEYMRPLTLYVQPGHYICLGDNSAHSSDSRAWGLVPDRLMLGRALVVYWPFGRLGPIR